MSWHFFGTVAVSKEILGNFRFTDGHEILVRQLNKILPLTAKN